MSWDQEDFLVRLRAAVDAYEGDRAAALCQELIDRLNDGEALQQGIGRKVLAALRRKCYFDLMEKVADALREAGFDDNQVRRQYAQALIDQGKISAAAYVLELLVASTADDPEENAEARGLLGRIAKQLFVNAVKEDPKSIEKHRTRQNLQKAVKAYQDVYQSDPARPLWHGINTVALVLRAERDKVELEGAPDARQIAQEILDQIEDRRKALKAEGKKLYAWDMATALEANVALGDEEEALVWLSRYVQNEDADAFELSSTERQLREIWGLTAEEPPGSLLLPLLQSAALKRKFGQVNIPTAQVAPTIEQTFRLEKTFGDEKFVPLGWYRAGLERCRGVAQIRNQFGKGLGTGFLLRERDFVPELGDGLLLLTNFHVIPKAVAADDAVIIFEGLESAAGKEYRVKEVLWSSPFVELDATLLRLDRPVEATEAYPIAENLPENDGKKKVYVIGHPLGGGLSFSLADNALLGYNERLVHYRAPTEGGSSGSPVFDENWKLIALHHGGGNGLKRLDGKPGFYDANEGIYIRRIFEAVKAAGVIAPPAP
jgi:hypothetical protein